MSAFALLNTLNAEQEQAVFAPQGPLLVLAGAGSGKTRVITARIVHSIESGYANPRQIVALTFTNKAAGEMAERCHAMLPKGSPKPFMGTFHAFGLRLLRAHADKLGYRRNFAIADYGDQLHLVRDLLTSDDVFESPKHALAALQRAKTQGLTPQTLAQQAQTAQQMELAALWQEYQKAMLRWGVMDFEDILQQSLRLTQEHPLAAQSFFGRYRCVLVDECQDTNPIQFDLLKAMVQQRQNLFAVGDDDQSIYGWRGAAPQNLLNFETHFPHAKVVRLESNYRSTEPILQAANTVIAHNQTRRKKTLRAHRGEGRGIGWIFAQNEQDEMEAMVTRMRLLRLQEGAEWGAMAVLLRANHQGRIVEETLREEGIPCRVVGGMRFYERKEIKDALAHLQVMAHPEDQMRLLRALQFPRRGIGQASLTRLTEEAQVRNKTPFMLLDYAPNIQGIPPAAAQSMARYANLLQRFQNAFVPGKLHTAFRDLLAELHFSEALAQEKGKGKNAQKPLAFIQELLRALEHFVERKPQASLNNYLEHVALLSLPSDNNADTPVKEVTILTVHAAKGLEFPCVFLPKLAEGEFPHHRSIQSGIEGIEEERRLFYVAITRAQRLLTLSSAHFKRRFKERVTKNISRFVLEIPAALFDGSAPNGEYPPEKREERKQIAKARFFAQMRQRGLGEALKE